MTLRRIRLAVAYSYITTADPGLDKFLNGQAALRDLRLMNILIDGPRSDRRAFDGLVRTLDRRRIHHVLLRRVEDLGENDGWLIQRALEAEFGASFHLCDPQSAAWQPVPVPRAGADSAGAQAARNELRGEGG
ncbi:MAG: hypothetical protein QOE58_1743 [Actinomycetota bacterium]|nr:hypothetical protein [Actinomycetota bacterium]